ncbi:MAG TPA: hypothetical protein VHO69_04510 [Phototrophicaceae bacterium]|nr:hypothetical protein [Phototrophicaceae bacterium]
MSTPNENLGEKANELKQRYEDFINRANLADLTNRVSSLTTNLNELPAMIAEIRSRGYVFRAFLEKKSEVLAQQWRGQQSRINNTIQREIDGFREQLNHAEAAVRQINFRPTLPAISGLESTLNLVQTQIEAAEERIQAMFSALESELNTTKSQIEEVKWFLQQKEEACFDFYPGEAVFMAAKAEWVATGKGKEDPDGILFLTDQRLVFEQKETVGGGLFRRGEQKQEKEWEVPLNAVEDVQPENKGFLGGKDMLHFTLGRGSDYPKITVEVKGGVDCKYWVREIKRMLSGEVKNERASQPDPELIEKLREAPTQCHVCSGQLPRLVAGQTEVECEYCGTVIRI